MRLQPRGRAEPAISSLYARAADSMTGVMVKVGDQSYRMYTNIYSRAMFQSKGLSRIL